MDKFEGRVRGKGLGRATWYSICSAHRRADPNCRLCMTGQYINDLGHRVDHAFYRVAPPLWRLWANRPGSPARRFLEAVFPNLK